MVRRSSMSPNVQSSNIGKLASELGFGPKIPERSLKTLDDLLKKVDRATLKEGNPIPLTKANSQQAIILAQQFCDYNSTGRTLWPENSNGLWPCWSTESDKIVCAIAHILSLKAFHTYQQALQRKKKARDRQDFSDSDDDLSSIISEDVVEPLTMPTMNSNGPLEAQASRDYTPPMVSSSSNWVDRDCEVKDCIDEVNRAEPSSYQNVPWITPEWLQNLDATLPPNVEGKLLHEMHSQNFYDRNKDDREYLALMKDLRGNIALSSSEFNVVKSRILERVESLAAEFWDKKLLTRDENSATTKSRLFAEYWNIRQSVWNETAAGINKSQKSAIDDPYSADNISLGMDTSKSRKRPKSLKDLNITPASLRSTASKGRSSSPSENTSPATKRLKTIITDEATRRSLERPTTRQSNSQSVLATASHPIPGDNEGQAPESAYAPRGPLHSPSPQSYGSWSATKPLQSTTTSIGTTPGSANATKAVTPDYELQAGLPSPIPHAPRQAVQPSPPATPRNQQAPKPAPNLEQVQAADPSHSGKSERPTSLQGSAKIEKQNEVYDQATAQNSYSNNQSPNVPGVVFILQKADLDHDLENLVPASEIRNLSLAELFQFVSERAEVPLDDLHCLTFMISFAVSKDLLLRKNGTEEDWRKLKDTIRSKFTYTWRKERLRSLFEVFVDLGDTTMGAEAGYNTYGGL